MRFSKRSLEGELFIDHRNSPGLPAEIAVQMGVPIKMVGKGQTLELAFYVCSHCDAEIILNPERVRPREMCMKCHMPICDQCHGVMQYTGQCRERSIRIEEFENQVAKSNLIGR